ncbi:MAG TPA: HmuY family protein [Saprospiraceae bacterium]|nr:HmuY family protein [Saprospiraceae bacterium]
MNKNLSYFILLAMVAMLTITACSKEEVVQLPLEATTTSFLTNGMNQGSFTLFSFENHNVVQQTDSASVQWDFGMRFVTFIFNSGMSGPGNAGVQVVTGVFDEIDEAPEAGYLTDTGTDNLAVKDDDWFVYNPVTRSFAPKAGQVFLIKTAQNKYAKMEVLTADPTDDDGNEVVPPTRPTKIKYTIRYVYQPSGSKSFLE